MPVPRILKILLILIFPLFLLTKKRGLEVPMENSADDEGVVEPMEKTPIKVEVAVVEVAVKYVDTVSPTTDKAA